MSTHGSFEIKMISLIIIFAHEKIKRYSHQSCDCGDWIDRYTSTTSELARTVLPFFNSIAYSGVIVENLAYHLV